MKPTRRFGTWPASIQARDLAAGGLRFGAIVARGGGLAWVEGRPEEDGRCVVVAQDGAGGKPFDVLAPPCSARSRVNEYGGGALWSDGDGLVFVNETDQDLYRLAADGAVMRITNKPGWRFADGMSDGRMSYVVAECHGQERLPPQRLCSVDHGSGDIAVIHEGRDFYSNPRLSPDGRQLAWIAWDLPYMPWQATELWLAPVTDDGVGPARLIGGGLNRAASQPLWSPTGVLHAVLEDRIGSRVHRWSDKGWRLAADVEGEAGRPKWVFDIRSCAILPDEDLVVLALLDGELRIFRADANGMTTALETPWRDVETVTALADGRIAGVASRDTEPSAIEVAQTATPVAPHVIQSSDPSKHDAADISVGKLQRYDTETGSVHAIHYPPASAGFQGPAGERPPMIVSAHGGPTSYASRGFRAKVQYWTQRGFAFLDVDYRGSFGYGPAYRRALDGEMGRIDIEDTVAAARGAAEAGLADPERLLISGGSAGGYVVLGALAYHDVFRAGCSRYGIGDLKVLAEATHKFEAGYLDTLLGLTGDHDHDAAVFEARSPINAAGSIKAPVLLLQGLDDKVVPPEQSRDMAAALTANGNPVALVEFEGEGHGFRRAETVIAAQEVEYAFYSAILGLEPAETLPPIEIENWPQGD